MSNTARMDKTPRLLFVTPVSPFATASGSEQRSNLMLSALSSLGQVDVLQLSQAEQAQVTKNIENGHTSVSAMIQASKSPITRYQPKTTLTCDIEHMLDCKISDYQLVVGRYVWPICQLVVPSQVPVIVDLDDFRYRYSGQTPWSLALLKERLAKALAHCLVRNQLKRFSGAFTVSEQDGHEVSGLPTAFLPNVPMHAPAHTTPVPNSKHIVFVGSLWYGPNVDGVNWFLTHVWPQIRTQEPTARLTLAGAAPQEVRARWEINAGVSAPGFAPDLAALYQQANLVVVPIHSGGGTNIKVLEAMAYGRPCLVSSFVAAAYGGQLADAKEMLVATNASDFAAKTVAALRMPSGLQGVADAGQLAVSKHFTHSQFMSRVTNLAESVMMKSATQNG